MAEKGEPKLLKYLILMAILFVIILPLFRSNNSSNINSRTLEIIEIFPLDNNFRVSIYTNISVIFNEQINNIENNFIIVMDDNGTHINGVISYNSSLKKLIFAPNSSLKYNTHYKIKCVIANNYTWRFKTESLIPILEKLYPMNQAMVDTTSLMLSWQTNYLNSTTDIIFYDIYFSTNKTKVIKHDNSTCILKKYTDTSYNLIALNGYQHYWTVIPHVGDKYGYCNNGVWSFILDISPPTISLMTPKDHEIIETNSIPLNWVKDHILTFDVYFNRNRSLVNNLNISARISNNQTESFYEIFNLSDGETYYWTVIPYDGQIGYCSSGTWSFKVNIDSDHDDFNDSIENKIGTNPLDNTIYPLDSDSDGTLDFYDSDDDNDDFTDKEELQADTNPLDPDDYPNKDNDRRSLDMNYTFYLILGIIIIILLIIFGILISLKKKNE